MSYLWLTFGQLLELILVNGWLSFGGIFFKVLESILINFGFTFKPTCGDFSLRFESSFSIVESSLGKC